MPVLRAYGEGETFSDRFRPLICLRGETAHFWLLAGVRCRRCHVYVTLLVLMTDVADWTVGLGGSGIYVPNMFCGNREKQV